MPVTYNVWQGEACDEIELIRSVGRRFWTVSGGSAVAGAPLLFRRVRQQEIGDAQGHRHQSGVDESARLLLPGRDGR